MANTQSDVFVEVNRNLPTPVAGDGVVTRPRASRHGEAYVSPIMSGQHTLADEGTYYVATNPTPLTGLATVAAADGLDDTEAFVYLKNTSSTKRVYLDYMRLQATAAGTNGTNISYAIKIDASSVDRYSSGGTAITPENVNMDVGTAAAATVYAGAVVASAASSSVRLLSAALLRNVIPVVGDTYMFHFGGQAPAPVAHAVAGTAIAYIPVHVHPVVLGPNQQFLFHLNLASQSGASSYEVELGFWQR